MSLVTGNYADLGSFSMGNYQAEITFELSAPATEPYGKKLLVSSAKKRSVIVDHDTSDWSLFLESTEGMAQDRFYRVTANFLNGEGVPVGFEQFPWEIRVPEGIWKFTDLVQDWSSPLAVGISVGPPDLLPAFWLDPLTGDFSRKKA